VDLPEEPESAGADDSGRGNGLLHKPVPDSSTQVGLAYVYGLERQNLDLALMERSMLLLQFGTLANILRTAFPVSDHSSLRRRGSQGMRFRNSDSDSDSDYNDWSSLSDLGSDEFDIDVHAEPNPPRHLYNKTTQPQSVGIVEGSGGRRRPAPSKPRGQLSAHRRVRV
jgi:hypothetical protein